MRNKSHDTYGNSEGSQERSAADRPTLYCEERSPDYSEVRSQEITLSYEGDQNRDSGGPEVKIERPTTYGRLMDQLHLEAQLHAANSEGED